MFEVRNRDDEVVCSCTKWEDALASTHETNIGHIEEHRRNENDDFDYFFWNFKGDRKWEELKTGEIKYEPK